MNPFRQAIKSIRRSPYQAAAAVLILFLTFSIGYSLVLFLVGSHRVLQYFESRPQVTAFFRQDTPEETLQGFVSQLEQKGYVKDIRYISQEEALEIYREQSGSDPVLLELVTADILPPSIEVSTFNLDQLSLVADDLRQLEGIDEVVYQKDVVDSLRYWSTLLRQIGLGIMAVFTVTSLLMILVITSIRIASKKLEIRILRLMGATKWYIQRPFLIEGMIYGVLGSVLAWSGVYIAVLYASPSIQQFFGEVQLLPIPILGMLMLLGAGTLFGLVLGMVASMLSARRLYRV